MLILSGDDVRAALPMSEAIQLMERAFAALARGDADVPLRTHLAAPGGGGITLVMPGRVEGEARSLAVKIVSVFEENPRAGLARIQAAVLVLEPDTGRPLALVEGSSLTAIRTAAASGVATDLLAKPGSSTLAVLGAGTQARSHIEAMCAVRPIAEVRVFAPTSANVDRLIVDVHAAELVRGEILGVNSAAEAVRGADIICTTTTSSTPVFDDADVRPGTHINAVGSYTPDACEVHGATVARSWIVVDERTAAWAEAGELIQALRDGRIGEDHVRAELGELVLDDALRPGDSHQTTLFKSVGLAVQDAVAAAAAVAGARRRGLGTEVAW